MPDQLPISADQDAVSEANRQLVETWASAQGSVLTRKSNRHQGGRLLDRLGVPLAAAAIADLQAFVVGLGDMAPATISLAVQP